MRFCSILFTLLLVFSSCGGKEEEKVVLMEQPSDLIAEDKMIQILADMHLLEAALQYRSPQVTRPAMGLSPDQFQTPIALPTDQKTLPYYDIFAKHTVTREQYETSLQWYMTDAALYGQMYDEVINELVRRQAEEQSASAVQLPGADSTK